jgi:hypothetical protein
MGTLAQRLRYLERFIDRVTDYTLNRAWENWARRAGREMQAQA